MTDFTGTAGKDNISGTAFDDHFDLSQGGNDKAFGLEGADVFDFGAAMTARDKIDGGDGSDVLNLAGDYSAGLAFGTNSLTSIESVGLAAGFRYDLTFDDANFAGTFTIDGRDLGAGDRLVVDARNDTDTAITMYGGLADDVLKGGGGNDVFVLTLGGSDKAVGGDGFNTYTMEGAFDSGDIIVGGASTDTMTLMGDYSAGLRVTTSMIQSVEVFNLLGAFDYDLTFKNGTLGTELHVNAISLGAGHSVVIDAHLEATGILNFNDSPGDDLVTGGDANDDIEFSHGGVDVGYGGLGGDTFSFGGALTDQDTVDGGDGDDLVMLSGDYSAGVTLAADTFTSIEALGFLFGADYDITLVDENVAAGVTMTVLAASLGASQHLTLDASAETDARFIFTGGASEDTIKGGAGNDVLLGNAGNDLLVGAEGDDTLTGGAGDDHLTGALGLDILNGGAGADYLNAGFGADTFVYTGIESDSSGLLHDTLETFNAALDKVDVNSGVFAVDPQINAGNLSAATFDADLAAAVGALGSNHVVVFVPSGGGLAGHTYLIIERAAGAGYQLNHDYVIEILNPSNLASLATSNFI